MKIEIIEGEEKQKIIWIKKEDKTKIQKIKE